VKYEPPHKRANDLTGEGISFSPMPVVNFLLWTKNASSMLLVNNETPFIPEWFLGRGLSQENHEDKFVEIYCSIKSR
jgi:hypothetical protein